MLKMSLGYVEKREASVIVLGLSEGNLKRLHERKPIRVNCNDLNLPQPGADLVLLHANHREHMEQVLERFVSRVTRQKSGKVVCICTEGLYVTILSQKTGRILYVIGLDTTTCKLLRKGHAFSFRSRMVEGEGTNIEVMLYWGTTEEALMQGIRKEGLIGDETKVIDA